MKRETMAKGDAGAAPTAEDERFYVNGRYLLREISGVFVLIPVGESGMPQNSITALNETGSFLWKQFAHPCTASEAAAAALAEYDGQRGQVESDIRAFIRAGMAAGLLRKAAKTQ